jgi:hypothetical protein
MYNVCVMITLSELEKNIYLGKKLFHLPRSSLKYYPFRHRKGGHWNTNCEKDILKFHGIGLASSPKLRAALKEEGLSFKS